MTRPRLRALLSTMRASLVAMVRTDRVALAWLRERERDLVRAYLRLDARPGLDESTRARLRCFLLPAAFERFTRADKLAIAAEHGSGVHA